MITPFQISELARGRERSARARRPGARERLSAPILMTTFGLRVWAIVPLVIAGNIPGTRFDD